MAGSCVSRRPVPEQLLAKLTAGDVLAVARLDRLGRSLLVLVDDLDDLDDRGIGRRALHGVQNPRSQRLQLGPDRQRDSRVEPFVERTGVVEGDCRPVTRAEA